uniref:homologous recombination OB-fold protein n=1 Tax=Jaculus jaculus TaxID=51337 RepID=UPI001E1AF866|nr:homologous recombination OB-fold protein [Jaculus jaculus]
MACNFQKLFSVEEEFEDEDFLSAVEDVENHFAGALPESAGHLRPVHSWPQEPLQAQSSRALLLRSTSPSEALSPPAQRPCLPSPSTPQAIRDPLSMGTAPLRPISTPSNWAGNQRRVTVAGGLQEPAGPQCSALHPALTFEEPEQGEFDKALASMELECGVNCEAAQTLPAQHQGDPVSAKKARVADLSGSFQKGYMSTPHIADVTSRQGTPLEPVVHCRTPWPCLRPGAAGCLSVSAASAVPIQQINWESCPKDTPLLTPQLLQAAGGPIQSSPHDRLPGQTFQSSPAWLSSQPRFPGPRTPNSSSAVFPRGSLPSRAPASSVASPICTPKGSHSSLVPHASPQTPVVTNHLVQLVTAASRTPQQPTRPSIQAKTRRFPGPAGLLPHQHSGKNLEEIMVSTPQTPTHGALAKFRTQCQIVPSSQVSVEEDFGRGPWLAMKSALGLDERDHTCFLYTYSIVMVLRKAALKQLPRNKVPKMAVMIKSLTRSTMDASVVFKDPTGEMLGTVHRVLLETRQNELKPGSVLLLKQIGVFSPSLRNHYLNVTPNNLVHIYGPDSGDGNFLKPSQPSPKDPGSFPDSLQPDVATQPAQGLRTVQTPEAGASPEEEHLETDDLDGLLSELPEDFFCGPSSWDCLKAGHPP